MHAWLCENPTGVEALTWKELPTPEPKAGEVLIQIQAASLNFPDLLIVQNKYQMKPELPFVPGSEYAGVIQAVGEGVTDLKVGQSVACLSGTGGFGHGVDRLCHILDPAQKGRFVKHAMINRHIETMTRGREKAVHAGLFHRAIPWVLQRVLSARH